VRTTSLTACAQFDAAEELANSAFDVLDTVRDGSLRDFEALKAATIDHIARETGVDPATVRSVAPDDALDAADFVSATLRDLVTEREEAVGRGARGDCHRRHPQARIGGIRDREWRGRGR